MRSFREQDLKLICAVQCGKTMWELLKTADLPFNSPFSSIMNWPSPRSHFNRTWIQPWLYQTKIYHSQNGQLSFIQPSHQGLICTDGHWWHYITQVDLPFRRILGSSAIDLGQSMTCSPVILGVKVIPVFLTPPRTPCEQEFGGLRCGRGPCGPLATDGDRVLMFLCVLWSADAPEWWWRAE